jgi:hypothetical protein
MSKTEQSTTTNFFVAIEKYFLLRSVICDGCLGTYYPALRHLTSQAISCSLCVSYLLLSEVYTTKRHSQIGISLSHLFSYTNRAENNGHRFSA